MVTPSVGDSNRVSALVGGGLGLLPSALETVAVPQLALGHVMYGSDTVDDVVGWAHAFAGKQEVLEPVAEVGRLSPC